MKIQHFPLDSFDCLESPSLDPSILYLYLLSVLNFALYLLNRTEITAREMRFITELRYICKVLSDSNCP